MATLRSKLLLFIMVIFIQSCVNIGENDPQEEEDFFVLDGEIEKINTDPGDKNVTLRLTNNLNLSLRIKFPDDVENVPFILAFHWEGDAESYNGYAECQAIPGLDHTEAIIVVPSIPGGIWWESKTEILILDLLEKMFNTWNIDQSRVALTGFSSGGTGAWLYGAAHPNIFSAVIPIAGSYNQDVAFQIPLYVIHSLDDESVPFEGVQNVVNASINRGSDIKLVLVEGVLHQQGCDYDEYLKEAGDWLLEEVWQ